MNRHYLKISPRPSFPKRGNKRELFQRGNCPSLWKREVRRDFTD